jgi:hypothetical protein
MEGAMRDIPTPDLPQAQLSEATLVGLRLADGVREIQTTYGVLMTLEHRRGTFATDPNEGHEGGWDTDTPIIIRSSQLDWFYPSMSS